MIKFFLNYAVIDIFMNVMGPTVERDHFFTAPHPPCAVHRC